MKWKASRGSAHHGFLTVLFIALLIIAVLFAAKLLVRTENVQQTYYPDQKAPNSVTIGGKSPSPAPVGVKVGGAPAPSPAGTPISSDSSTPAAKGSVNYTDGGFSPQMLTIKQGVAITFFNKSSKSFALLSETSMTAPGFGGFNAQSVVEPGQAITIVFDAPPRTYKYYNRLNTAHRGSIVVE